LHVWTLIGFSKPPIEILNPWYLGSKFVSTSLRGFLLTPIQRIPSPQDLINLWEDYVFMSLMRKNDACSVKHILSPSAELCRVLVITVFLDLHISWIRELLDITWTEFRTILCSVRPTLASDAEQVLRGSAKHVVHASVPPEMQQAVFRELALGCIRRVIKSHGPDGINGRLEWSVPQCKTDNFVNSLTGIISRWCSNTARLAIYCITSFNPSQLMRCCLNLRTVTIAKESASGSK
jgi:hypothetical protein